MSATHAAPPDRADSGRLPYMPALDGLRGVFVVLGPLLYHARPESIRGGPDILPGGILSLDLFFVLSSFLIVSIALREWDSTGRIDLVAYAGRRARRLLPALFTALAGVTLYLAWAGDPEIVPRWTGAIVSALTYSANWHEIFVGASYFEQFDSPSPLKHVWSFAIEEQFYLFAPLFVIAGCAWFGRRRGWVMLAAAVAAAVASAVWMARLHAAGEDPSRVYYGTDTRAQALFVGIALAVAARICGPPASRAGRAVLRAAAYPAAALFLWMITNVSERDEWMFERGGFLLVAAVSAVIIYSMAQPSGRHNLLQRFFELAPIRYAGRISYGLYLYHWPVYLLVTGERAGALLGLDRITGYRLLAVHLVLTFCLAAASYHLIERPVMQRRWPALRRPVTLAWGACASTAAVAVILAGLLLANSTRPARIEQVLVPMAAPAQQGGAGAEGGSVSDAAGPAGEAAADAVTGGSSGSARDGSAATPGAGLDAGDPDAGSAPAAADPDETESTDAARDAPGRSGPLRVLVVGDSVAAQIGASLRLWGEEHPGEIVLFNESHIGCTVGRNGLKRLPEGEYGPVGELCSNWAAPVEFDQVADSEVVSWPTALEVFGPTVVVAHVSPWDVLDRVVPGVVDDWASIGDPVYDAFIRDEYAAASELLTSTGATLYWLEGAALNRAPAFDDHDERIRGLNRIVAQGAAALADRRIVMVDYPSFVGEAGSERELAIRDDGVHLSEQGFSEVAPWLVEIITSPTPADPPSPSAALPTGPVPADGSLPGCLGGFQRPYLAA